MSRPGVPDGDLLVRARAALLDALDALGAHRASVIVIGAQAIYLRAVGAPVALAEATKDSDILIDPRSLSDDPLIEAAMARGGFHQHVTTNQPGAWLNADGVPVDLLVPERLAGGGGRSARSARIPPHDRRAARRARGLEAAIVDNDVLRVTALTSDDARIHDIRVAGMAAMLVAKAHKIGERASTAPDRLVDKDAHDVYRVLVASDTGLLAAKFKRLLGEELSAGASAAALEYLRELFAAGPDAVGSMMAGRAEEGIGEPATVALQTSILVSDLLAALGV